MKTSIITPIILIVILAIVGLFVFTRNTTIPISSGKPLAEEESITLDVLNWEDFRAKLAKPEDEHAQITVVDAWAMYCVPCRKNFHHLVSLHEKYAVKGLRTISLSLDDRDDPATREGVTKFLTDQRAMFTNVLLDEEMSVGFEKLNINAIPAVFLYDASGNEIKRFTGDDPNNPFTYEQVEKVVVELLEQQKH